MAESYKRVGHFKDVGTFRSHLAELGIDLPVDERIQSAVDGSPLGEPFEIGSVRVGNRWCIHPMEGWDGTADGRPSEYTMRRWRHFGQSGAKLIWGGEALAVQRDGRANPNQLYYRPQNVSVLANLYRSLVRAHVERFGQLAAEDLLVGLQLTHSGRFSRPNHKTMLEPQIVYHHPLLDDRVGIDPADASVVMSDDAIKRLIDSFIIAAKAAHQIGFQFVDVKHCHGYLGHEFLSAYDRPGPYGGDLIGRTRFMRQIVEGIRAECPRLMIGVRLSVFDIPPHHPAPAAEGRGPGIPDDFSKILPYAGFGCQRDEPMVIDLAEPIQLMKMMRDDLKIDVANLSAGSPYYNPHIQRPAFFPPSDGYRSPEDPLVGCARQIQNVHKLKQAVPGLPVVGSAYSYFQDWLPHVAQGVVREGWVDFVGIGRMVLAYWDLPADCLEFGTLRRSKQLCRTFSDCTTAPRSGIISGCFPLDDYYKKLPAATQIRQAKAALRNRG